MHAHGINQGIFLRRNCKDSFRNSSWPVEIPSKILASRPLLSQLDQPLKLSGRSACGRSEVRPVVTTLSVNLVPTAHLTPAIGRLCGRRIGCRVRRRENPTLLSARRSGSRDVACRCLEELCPQLSFILGAWTSTSMRTRVFGIFVPKVSRSGCRQGSEDDADYHMRRSCAFVGSMRRTVAEPAALNAITRVFQISR
jgi:hypothetical protein